MLQMDLPYKILYGSKGRTLQKIFNKLRGKCLTTPTLLLLNYVMQTHGTAFLSTFNPWLMFPTSPLSAKVLCS